MNFLGNPSAFERLQKHGVNMVFRGSTGKRKTIQAFEPLLVQLDLFVSGVAALSLKFDPVLVSPHSIRLFRGWKVVNVVFSELEGGARVAQIEFQDNKQRLYYLEVQLRKRDLWDRVEYYSNNVCLGSAFDSSSWRPDLISLLACLQRDRIMDTLFATIDNNRQYFDAILPLPSAFGLDTIRRFHYIADVEWSSGSGANDFSLREDGYVPSSLAWPRLCVGYKGARDGAEIKILVEADIVPYDDGYGVFCFEASQIAVTGSSGLHHYAHHPLFIIGKNGEISDPDVFLYVGQCFIRRDVQMWNSPTAQSVKYGVDKEVVAALNNMSGQFTTAGGVVRHGELCYRLNLGFSIYAREPKELSGGLDVLPFPQRIANVCKAMSAASIYHQF